MGDSVKPISQNLCLSPENYFLELVTEAFEDRKIKTFPAAQKYLSQVLEFYVSSNNLFDEVNSSGKKTEGTLAESLLKAMNSEPALKFELLRKMADRSLYISGYFRNSLQRKLVDIDYYADMGGTAYAALADTVRLETTAQIYREYSRRFLEFADALSYISAKTQTQNEDNLLRLYETYAKTGSEYARDQLLEKGLISHPINRDSLKKQ